MEGVYCAAESGVESDYRAGAFFSASHCLFPALLCVMHGGNTGTQSTVILAVNISFLAVPSVLVPGSPTSPQAISTYISTMCIVGSLVVSVVLSGQVNDKRRENAQGAVRTWL